MGNKNKALMTGTIIYAIGNFGTKILSFLIVPLYTYYITPDALGDYDLLMTTVSLLSPLITMKVSDATYRWIINNEQNEEVYISATYTLLIRNCVIAALILLTLNCFIPIWNCYYFVAILVLDRTLECLQKILRGLKRQKLFAGSGLLFTTLFVSQNLYRICVLKHGVISILQSSIVSYIITIAFILLLENKLRIVKLFKRYGLQHREMLKYSIPLVPSALCWWVMSASDRYVIKWFIGSAANGIYSVAYKFPSILQTLFVLFNNSWTDLALAELDKGEKTKEYTKEVFERLYRVSFGMVFVLIPITKLAANMILSSDYKVASVYIGFLYLGTVFQGLSSFISIGYLRGKKTGGAAKTSIIGAAVNLVVDLLLIRYIGLFAASLSTFLGFFAMWVYRMHDVKEEAPIIINYKRFIPYLLLGVLLAIGTIWTTNYIDLFLSLLACVFFVFDNISVLQSLVKHFTLRRGQC